ncbi:hypothetical protein [Phyllobacterium sophorae]|uniref:Uncharacterized protein n=1 Tax=Phyllobacterium sophorae TaxID=1520277 RepID=A0A2P7BDZ4_9HYPH|nr:hypothetical protein [Phyllobacterium sophorae]PSH64681.1 hypothetical protein CU103_12420 [Phyllobacterium sophorae]
MNTPEPKDDETTETHPRDVYKTHTLEDTFSDAYEEQWHPSKLKFKSPGRPRKYFTEEEQKAARNKSMAKYMKKRRSEDPEFHAKQRESQKAWYEKKGREYMRTYMAKRYQRLKAEKQIQIEVDQ